MLYVTMVGELQTRVFRLVSVSLIHNFIRMRPPKSDNFGTKCTNVAYKLWCVRIFGGLAAPCGGSLYELGS